MAAIGIVDNPPHLIETPRTDASPVFFLSVYGNENELHCVHAGNINAVLSPIDTPPLHYAVRHNNVELVRILLRNGADVNLRDNAGNSPLLLNLKCNEIFHLLLESGADVNARHSNGWTALHSSRCHSMVRELLQRGADVHARDNHGRTPLDWHRAWSIFSEDNSSISELLHWGAEIDEGNQKVVFTLVQDEAVCSMELFRKVFEGTGHADIRDGLMSTPLHDAVRAGRIELVRVLLECGASVAARDWQGHTPLRTAVDFKCGVEVVSELIRKGADVNAKCDAGHTPLGRAFFHENEAVVGLLLSAGADPDVVEYVFSSNLCYPLLVKHSVLRNHASRREYMQSSDHPWRNNSFTCWQCFDEIRDMKSIRLSRDLTLFDVAFGDKWEISCTRKVYKYMSSSRFPFYSGLALPKLALNVRKHLSDPANNNSVFVQVLFRKTGLRINQHVLHEVVKYLSNDDCLNMYLSGF